VIRVLLAEDQGMMRGALALLLDLEDDIEVVAQVKAGDQVLASARETSPDVALLDIEMPGRSGLDVAAGRRLIDPALAAAALSAGPNPLTDRERDVLAAADGGATIADIAKRLFLSESTVRNYLSSAIGKTGIRNRIEAVQTARHNGWL
jgi:two-component system response regulator DesR